MTRTAEAHQRQRVSDIEPPRDVCRVKQYGCHLVPHSHSSGHAAVVDPVRQALVTERPTLDQLETSAMVSSIRSGTALIAWSRMYSTDVACSCASTLIIFVHWSG